MKGDVKKRVGILRGGNSENYETSLHEGGDLILYILEHLNNTWQPIDIFIDRNEAWYVQGILTKPAKFLQKVDVVLDTTHSNASLILESLGIPNISVKSFSLLLQKNRILLEDYVKNIGVKMPRSILLPLYQKDFDGPREKYAMKKAQEVFAKFSSPWIVRSYPPDTSMGVHVAKTFSELINAIEDGVLHKSSILIEELITGKIAQVHSVSHFRDEDIYSLPVIAWIKDKGVGVDNLLSEETLEITKTVRDIYKHLGNPYYLNSNFIFNQKRGLFLTSILFTPNFKDPHFAYSCESVGIKAHDVFEHILNRAL